MAIVNGYVTLEEFKRYLSITDASLDDLLFEMCVESASRAVDGYCGRYFYADSSATARPFLATNSHWVKIDDVWDTATAVVKIDSGQDGTFETTLTVSTQYVFEPVNGVQAGIAGWPASRVRLVGGQAFTSATYGRPQLQVTAKWGWAAVPSPVQSATMQVGAEIFKRKDAPLGYLENPEFGPIRMSADVMRSVMSLLAPYGAGSAQVGALAQVDIEAVKDEIATRLSGIDGLHAYARWPSAEPHMPAAIVTDDDPYVEPHQTFGASQLIYVHLMVRVVVAASAMGVDRAVVALDGWVIQSILDAVYADDKTLGGLVQDVLEVSVSGLREVPIGGSLYLGHEIPFTVIARHG